MTKCWPHKLGGKVVFSEKVRENCAFSENEGIFCQNVFISPVLFDITHERLYYDIVVNFVIELVVVRMIIVMIKFVIMIII